MKKVNRNRKSRIKIAVVTLIVVVLAALGGLGGYYYFRTRGTGAADSAEQSGQEQQPAEQKTASFHFTGVVDNLLHDPIYYYFEQDYGNRNYLPIYEETLKYTNGADLSYINFETLCAGDAFGLSGYPNFNGPTEMMDTLRQAGFNWFSTSSNHSYDRQTEGLMAEMNYINENLPGIAYTGTSLTEEASNTPKVVDINGIKVGLESFTYGLNGYTLPEGEEWLVNQFLTPDGQINYDLMKKKLDALKAVSDVQIVTMHWGDEYQTVPSELQKEAARFLNEQGVEVVIGTHPPVIQPAELLSTPEQETLIYYSLGNFVSAQDAFERMIGGMADFDLNYDFTTGKTTFSNVKFIPTITYITPDLRTYRTTTIHEYNNELAANHYIQTVEGQDMSREAVQAFVRQVMGEPQGIEVVYE